MALTCSSVLIKYLLFFFNLLFAVSIYVITFFFVLRAAILVSTGDFVWVIKFGITEV